MGVISKMELIEGIEYSGDKLNEITNCLYRGVNRFFRQMYGLIDYKSQKEQIKNFLEKIIDSE